MEMMDAAQDGAAVDAVGECCLGGDSRAEDGEEEEELTPLEYARLHGLTRDYLSDSSASDHINVLKGIIDSSLNGLMTDHSHLPRLSLGPPPDLRDRFSAPREAINYLQGFRQDLHPDEIEAIMDPMLTPRKLRSLRVELPLLRSDHETDVISFSGERLREGFEIKLQDIKLPLEIVDEKSGEGLSIPSKYLDVAHKIVEDIKKERLKCSKETLMYLEKTIQASWDQEDEDKLWAAERTHHRKKFPFEPVTPPLLPMSPPPSKYEPSSSSPTFAIPLAEESESMIKQDLEEIEKHVLKEGVLSPIRDLWVGDQPSKELHKMDGTFLPIPGNDKTPPMPPRFKSEDHKVEEILTPQNQTTWLKEVRFSEHVEIMLLDPPMSSAKTDEIREVLQHNFREAHEKATRESEQENLIEADNMSRVDVHTMPAVAPVAPWAKSQQSTNAIQLLDLQKEMLCLTVGRLPSWKSKNLGTKLNWTPFSSKLAKVDSKQEPPPSDDTEWMDILGSENEEVIDSSGMTWKPEGLRILQIDEDDDDDDIEPGKFYDQPQDISSLVKKRKKDLEQGEVEGQPSKPHMDLIASLARPQNTPRHRKHNDSFSAAQKMQVDSDHGKQPDMLLGGAFSAGNLIENFKELRGAKKPKLHDKSYFAGETTVPKPSKSAGADQHGHVPIPIRKSPLPILVAAPLPAPSLIVPSTPIGAIVSSTLLKHRILIKHLESLIPSLTLVERDFSAHNTTTWMPGSVTRSPVTSPLDSEADLVISPSTGILISSFQKVKQRPLPGQKGKTAIQSRLCKVSARYEKLIVLVTEERKDETTEGLNDNDCVAVTEFIGFASGLPTSITVQFVAGGEETLAKWVASTIVQHIIAAETNLLTDETHWELFLRRAGLNAYAAQYIVAELKSPEGVNGSSPSKSGYFGLAAFVEMGREDRLARFGPVCGRKLMERVSDLVDGRWR